MPDLRKFVSDRNTRSEFIAEIKWIVKNADRYRYFILIYIVLGIIGVVLGFASGIASKYLIDAVSEREKKMLFSAFAIFAVMGVLSLVFSALNQRLQAKIQSKVTNDLRADIFTTVLGADWQSITKYHSGDLLNRISSDVPQVVRFLLNGIPGFLIKSFRFIGAFFIIFYYDKVLALIALLGAPVLVLASRLLIGRMREMNKKSKEASAELMSFSEETMQSISFIKSFSLSRSFLHRYGKLQDKQRNILLDYNKYSVLTSAVIGFIGLVVSFISYGWGVYRLWNGVISYGTMVLFIQLAGNLTSSFSSMIGILPEAISASTSAGRLMTLKDVKREEAADNTDRTSVFPPSIVFENVSFAYKSGEKVIDNASFEISHGETAAFIGMLGSGKTTVLRLILGLVSPDCGLAYLVTPDGKEMLSEKTRRCFSYVSQENMIFSGTIAENLRLVRPNATDGELAAALKTACADFVFDLPDGLQSQVMHGVSGFSSGQIQRLAIARALLCDAPVLLLDEATSALDKETEAAIIRNIFQSEIHKTCILTTHRDSLLQVCDKIYSITDGHIKEYK